MGALRILALGKRASDIVQADVYLLTDIKPALLPRVRGGLTLRYSGAASEALLRDLRSDKGMEWMPASMWLTHLAVDSSARDLTYDLAIDASGRGRPSRIAAGLQAPRKPLRIPHNNERSAVPFIALLLVGAGVGTMGTGRRGRA